eukprot:SAG11_NODE_1016_length_6169_cov_19.544975_2_plen_112_part_00
MSAVQLPPSVYALTPRLTAAGVQSAPISGGLHARPAAASTCAHPHRTAHTLRGRGAEYTVVFVRIETPRSSCASKHRMRLYTKHRGITYGRAQRLRAVQQISAAVCDSSMV